jgi:glyoxylase-like metal-dependent hydrolase (beta-lactamase superfamily II)
VTAPDVVRIDDELTARRIAEDAFVITHEPFFASNVLAVRMPDGTVVLCSSPFETQATRALVGWVRSALRPTRIVTVNTHFHFDGTGGNEAYRELGVETWGTSTTRALLQEKGARMQRDAAEELDAGRRARVLAMKLVAAEHTFVQEEGLTLTLGSAEVRVVHPGGGALPGQPPRLTVEVVREARRRATASTPM